MPLPLPPETSNPPTTLPPRVLRAYYEELETIVKTKLESWLDAINTYQSGLPSSITAVGNKIVTFASTFGLWDLPSKLKNVRNISPTIDEHFRANFSLSANITGNINPLTSSFDAGFLSSRQYQFNARPSGIPPFLWDVFSGSPFIASNQYDTLYGGFPGRFFLEGFVTSTDNTFRTWKGMMDEAGLDYGFQDDIMGASVHYASSLAALPAATPFALGIVHEPSATIFCSGSPIIVNYVYSGDPITLQWRPMAQFNSPCTCADPPACTLSAPTAGAVLLGKVHSLRDIHGIHLPVTDTATQQSYSPDFYLVVDGDWDWFLRSEVDTTFTSLPSQVNTPGFGASIQTCIGTNLVGTFNSRGAPTLFRPLAAMPADNPPLIGRVGSFFGGAGNALQPQMIYNNSNLNIPNADSDFPVEGRGYLTSNQRIYPSDFPSFSAKGNYTRFPRLVDRELFNQWFAVLDKLTKVQVTDMTGGAGTEVPVIVTL